MTIRIDSDIDIKCATCESELSGTFNFGKNKIELEPCDNCIAGAFNEGKEEGESNG